MSNSTLKSYTAPAVKELGDLKEMTQAGQLWPADGGNRPNTAEPVFS